MVMKQTNRQEGTQICSQIQAIEAVTKENRKWPSVWMNEWMKGFSY